MSEFITVLFLSSFMRRPLSLCACLYNSKSEPETKYFSVHHIIRVFAYTCVGSVFFSFIKKPVNYAKRRKTLESVKNSISSSVQSSRIMKDIRLTVPVLVRFWFNGTAIYFY